jgi:hypothetical protein
MQIVADSWTKQPFPKTPDSTFNPPTPSRNDSAQGFFQTFRLGVGGPCASRFTPAASYWCGDGSQGGFTLLRQGEARGLTLHGGQLLAHDDDVAAGLAADLEDLALHLLVANRVARLATLTGELHQQTPDLCDTTTIQPAVALSATAAQSSQRSLGEAGCA